MKQKPVDNQPPLPTSELWRALLLIFEYYLCRELLTFRLRPEGQRIPDPVVQRYSAVGLLAGYCHRRRVACG